MGLSYLGMVVLMIFLTIAQAFKVFLSEDHGGRNGRPTTGSSGGDLPLYRAMVEERPESTTAALSLGMSVAMAKTLGRASK